MISSGGARVSECTQRSIRETVRDARLRFPWRIMVFVMNCRRGSSAGGMSKAGGGKDWTTSEGGVGEEGVDVMPALRTDKGFWRDGDATVDRDLVIEKKAGVCVKRSTDNMMA